MAQDESPLELYRRITTNTAIRIAEERVAAKLALVHAACESDIERLLATVFVTLTEYGPPIRRSFRAEIYAGNEEFSSLDDYGDFATERLDHYRELGAAEQLLAIYVQAPLDRYRLDFLFGFIRADDTEEWVAVECDGHDWHERTKEQAARDKSRDRRLARLGIRVLRFTGSEIWRDPDGCGCEILGVLTGVNPREAREAAE